jgi:hypothetical protein
MNNEDEILKRLARIEARLCQLMLHVGLDPQERVYDEPRPVEQRNQEMARVWRQRDRPP